MSENPTLEQLLNLFKKFETQIEHIRHWSI